MDTAEVEDGPRVSCARCLTRTVLLPGMTLQNTRCACGGSFAPYQPAPALDAPAPPRLQPALLGFWLQGREDGYWNERRSAKRLFMRADNGTAWAEYLEGRRAGLALRRDALRSASDGAFVAA